MLTYDDNAALITYVRNHSNGFYVPHSPFIRIARISKNKILEANVNTKSFVYSFGKSFQSFRKYDQKRIFW